jgi:molybdenum cofactor biosynthesis protein MoaC
MVNVSPKAHTARRAIAIGYARFSSPKTLALVESAAIKKGDVLDVSRIAGIMAAKNCPTIVPLCHPIALTGVEVDVSLSKENVGGVKVQVEVTCVGPTGVEMEALTGVMGSLLSVVDMVKAVDKGVVIEGVKVVLKEGGRSGTWRDETWTE